MNSSLIKIMLKILVSLAPMAISACGNTNSSDDANVTQDRQDQEQSEKLRAEFATIEGLYSGTVVAKDRKFLIDLRLLTFYVENGLSASGKTRYLPKLKAVLTFNDTTEDDIELAASYFPESGDLILSAVKSSGTTNPNNPTDIGKFIYSLKAKFNGQLISGEIRRNTSTLGDFEVQLKAKKVEEITEAERNERLRGLISVATGVFVVNFPLASVPDHEVEIQITVPQTGKPYLIVGCRFTDQNLPEAMTAEIDLIPANPLLTLTILKNSLSTTCPFQAISGYLIGDSLIAETAINRRGQAVRARNGGPLIFKKKM